MPRQELPPNWNMIWLVVGGVTLCIALVVGGLTFPSRIVQTQLPSTFPFPTAPAAPHQVSPTVYPFRELLKLVSAALIGIVVTYLNRRFHGDKPLPKTMEQAQILLCVTGAMMMVIIGGDIARALGVAGAAGIIRFRTPVEDPKDAVLLLLLVSMGMAAGLGEFALAGLGTLFLCGFIWILHGIGEAPPRTLTLAVVTDRTEFPSGHVQQVLNDNNVEFEPREMSATTVRYQVSVPAFLPLEELSKKLMGGGLAGVKSVAFETPKKGKRAED
jgi:hypothetical protein